MASTLGTGPSCTNLVAENDRLRQERDAARGFKSAFRKLMRDDRAFKLVCVSIHPDKRGEMPAELREHAQSLFEQAVDARKRI